MRYHINPNGPAPCRADLDNPDSRGCPFKDESGETVPHYDTPEAAELAFHEQNAGSFDSVITKKPKPATKKAEKYLLAQG